MREYEVAVGRAVIVDAKDIQFKLGKDVLTAKSPTTGQLALFLRSGRGLGLGAVEGLLEFVSDILNDRDWRRVENHLRDGLDVNILSNIVNDLIGEWSGRPTTPSPASSPTPKGTGRRSTVKPRSTAKANSSRSRSTASATSSSGGAPSA